MDENQTTYTAGVVCEGCFTFDVFGAAWDGYSLEATVVHLGSPLHPEYFLPEFKKEAFR